MIENQVDLHIAAHCGPRIQAVLTAYRLGCIFCELRDTSHLVGAALAPAAPAAVFTAPPLPPATAALLPPAAPTVEGPLDSGAPLGDAAPEAAAAPVVDTFSIEASRCNALLSLCAADVALMPRPLLLRARGMTRASARKRVALPDLEASLPPGIVRLKSAVAAFDCTAPPHASLGLPPPPSEVEGEISLNPDKDLVRSALMGLESALLACLDKTPGCSCDACPDGGIVAHTVTNARAGLCNAAALQIPRRAVTAVLTTSCMQCNVPPPLPVQLIHRYTLTLSPFCHTTET